MFSSMYIPWQYIFFWLVASLFFVLLLLDQEYVGSVLQHSYEQILISICRVHLVCKLYANCQEHCVLVIVIYFNPVYSPTRELYATVSRAISKLSWFWKPIVQKTVLKCVLLVESWHVILWARFLMPKSAFLSFLTAKTGLWTVYSAILHHYLLCLPN